MIDKTTIKSKIGAAIEIKESPANFELLLPEEEKILWTGQPDPKKLGYAEISRIVAGSLISLIIGGLLIAFLVSLLLAKPDETANAEKWNTGALILVLLIPFVGLGVLTALHPNSEIQRKKKIQFYVTNKRAFAKCGGENKITEHSLDLLRSVKTTILPGKNGSGTIVFDELPANIKQQMSDYQPKQVLLLKNTLVFFDVDNVEEVEKTIKSVIAESTCESVKQLDRTEAVKRKRILPGLFTSIYQFRLQFMLVVGTFLIIAIAPMCYLIGSQSRSFGYVDKAGTLIVKPVFDEVGNFSEGLAPACMPFSHDHGYVDKTGKFVIKPKFIQAEPFSEGLAVVAMNNKEGYTKYGYVDHSGNVVIPATFDRAQDFSGGLAAVMLRPNPKSYTEVWGFIDTKGKWRVQPKLVNVGKFVNGIAPAYYRAKDEGLPCLIDENGKILVKLDCGIEAGDPGTPKGFSDGLLLASVYEPYANGFIDTHGKFVIAPQFDEGRSFSDGLAAVCVKEKWGYIDTKGAWVIKPQFANAKDFKSGLAPVFTNGSWGYINRTGNLVIKPAYKAAESFSESLARVQVKDGEELLIDRSGNVVAKGKSCGDMHQGLTSVSQ